MNISKIKIVAAGSLTAAFFIAGTLCASAATLNVAASQPSVLLNQPFRVDLQLNTQGDDMNAIQASIHFPSGMLSVQGILDGGSPVSFWVSPPKETASGTISFAGIIPNGFEGAASSVVSVWFLPTASGNAAITLADVSVLENDGAATPLRVATGSATVAISTTAATSTASRPISFTVPNSFTPIVSRDANIFNGKYFLAFSTTDEGSGMAYYQVLEIPAGGDVAVATGWQTAASPYLLQDQSLASDIYVRAVDNDGNFIVVKVPAAHPGQAPVLLLVSWGWWRAVVIVILGALVVALALLLRRRRRRRHS